MLEGTVACGQIYRSIFLAGITVYQAVETHNAAFARIAYHLYLLLISGLEAYGRCCRNVQVTTECRLAVKFQVTIYLEKVEVRTHLNRAITRIAYCYGYSVTLQIVGYILVAWCDTPYGHRRCGIKSSIRGI